MNSASQYQYQMCSCPKTHPEAVFRPHLASGSLRFKKCPALILKYENAAQIWINSEGMRSTSQKMSRNPCDPSPTCNLAAS